MGNNTRFSEVRKNLGLTQEKVADQLKIAKNTLSQWENEKREPDIKTLKSLANIYNCSVDYLLGCNEGKQEKRQPEQVELEIEEDLTDKQKELLNIIKNMDNDDVNKVIGYAYSLNEKELSTEEKIKKLLKEYKNNN